MFHEGTSTAELGRKRSFLPFPYTLPRKPLPSLSLLGKPWKTQNSWQKETPLDLPGYLQCWTIATKIWSVCARSVERHALSQGITSKIPNLLCLTDVAPVPHTPQGDTALHIWDVQQGISEMRKAKDGRLDLQPLKGFKGLSWTGKHWGHVLGGKSLKFSSPLSDEKGLNQVPSMIDMDKPWCEP